MTWDPRDPMSEPCHECGAEAGASCSPDCGEGASGGAEGGGPFCPWCLDDESSCAMCGGHDYGCTCLYCQEAMVP
jgi:hypothetical protein